MKALDTPVLVALLHGGRGARELLRRLRGLEVATTELNLLELHAIVARGPTKGRARRTEGIERLRRGLTVLAYDAKAASRLSRRGDREGTGGAPPLVLGALATLEASGCDELITIDPASIPGKWQFRVSKFGKVGSK
jgi:predicted nucleic acid-binding protein